MSLYIPEMNLPTVWPKTITIYPDGTIEDIKRSRNYEKAYQVDAHGRLIDADEFHTELQMAIDDICYSYLYLEREDRILMVRGIVYAKDMLGGTRTIIPRSANI